MNDSANNAAIHFVDRHVDEGRGHKIAYIDDEGSYTYAQLASRVNRAGTVLRELGIVPGERIVLCLLDGIDFAALFWGALKIGAVPVPVNTFLGARDYEFMLRDSGAVAVAVSCVLLQQLESALSAQPRSSLRHVLVCGGTPPAAYESFEGLTMKASENLDALAMPTDEAGFWLYSSGSTGVPKAVMHHCSSLVQTAELFGRSVLGMAESDVVFSASKMFFAYGLGNSLSFPLHVGATAVVTAARPTAEHVLRILRQRQPSIFCGVPTLYVSLLGSIPEGSQDRFARLRLCTSAGEALPPSVSPAWAQRVGVEILDGLGSTEALHIFISNRHGEIRAGSSGKPVAGYEVELRDELGHSVADGEIGDLWCRGPSLAVGYWNQRKAWERTLVNGWLRTGDKYVRDGDGYFHHAGRSDDMLKVGGIWVSPIEVESALMAHPQVLEAAVVGAADADELIKPKAFVVLKSPQLASPQMAGELKAFVKNTLAPFKYPRWIEFRSELPRTATGKLRRHELR